MRINFLIMLLAAMCTTACNTLKNPCSYYGGNAYTGDDLHAGEMVAEACLWAATQGIDFSQYDWDADGDSS